MKSSDETGAGQGGSTPSPSAEAEEAKVIVDMTGLGEDVPDDTMMESPEQMDQNDPRLSAARAFSSPLTSPPVPGAPAGDPPAVVTVGAPVDAAFDEPPDDSLEVVKPPDISRLILVLLLLVIGSVVTFVAWRNDWGPIWENPREAFETAFSGQGPRPEPVADPTKTVEIAPTPAVKGELKVEHVQMDVIGGGVVAVHGMVTNETGKPHTAVTIEASLTDQKAMPIKQRVVACCTAFSKAQAKEITDKKDHPHFSTALPEVGQFKLAPGEQKAFTVLFRGLGRDVDQLNPEARVKHAEILRAP